MHNNVLQEAKSPDDNCIYKFNFAIEKLIFKFVL